MTFTYDNYGNIDFKSEYAFTLGELGAVVDTVDYDYDAVWKDKLTSYDGQGITYDAIGNPTNYMGATMTWNGRQLMSYSKDGTNVSYTYDGDGLRTSKTVNGVKHNYYYVDGVLMYEKNDVYDYYYRYDQDGRLAMIIRRRLSDNYKWYYYIVSNTRGDIMEIHNGQGQITAKYNYDAWGKLVSITNANGTPLADGSFAHLVSVRYRGYYYDTETGLYYLQSRYYDPETGRFINADDESIINPSVLNESFIEMFYSITNDLAIEPISAFARSGGILDDRITEEEVAFFAEFLYIISFLYVMGLPTDWLNGSLDRYVQILFNIDPYYRVEKTTFISRFETYSIEFILLNGTSASWSMYMNTDTTDLGLSPRIVWILGIVLTVLGLLCPGEPFIEYAGYTLTAWGLLNDGMEIGSTSWKDKHKDYISSLIGTMAPDEYLTIVYKINYVEYKNGKEVRTTIYSLEEHL